MLKQASADSSKAMYIYCIITCSMLLLCCDMHWRFCQQKKHSPAALAMPPHAIPSIIAAPDGGMYCTWYRWMKKDVSTVVISSNQTRVSSSYTYNKRDTRVKVCTFFTEKVFYCAMPSVYNGLMWVCEMSRHFVGTMFWWNPPRRNCRTSCGKLTTRRSQMLLKMVKQPHAARTSRFPVMIYL